MGGGFPNRELPAEPVPDLAPDRAPDPAVEAISARNTPQGMSRELRDYFDAGVRLVCYADTAARTIPVYSGPADEALLPDDGVLNAGEVLPGSSQPVREWFDRSGRPREA